MKLLNLGDFLERSAPEPDKTLFERIIDEKDEANKVQVMFVIVPSKAPPGKLHFHTERESLILVLSGEGKETVEGKEYSIKANDLLFIPAKEKHSIENTGNTELKYIEIYSLPSDFIPVE